MKLLGAVVAVAWAAAACTSDSDALSSKQLSAANIRYDNGGAGLVSTNVQDAIDDVVAMAQATDERVASSMIVCKFATASLAIPSQTGGAITPHVFTAAECGGRLPDAGYVGAVSRMNICNSITGVQVMNVGEPDGPGIVVRSWGGCTGPAELAAIFYRMP
jgi:hypothetical protein